MRTQYFSKQSCKLRCYLIKRSLMCSTRVAATSAIFLNRNFWKNKTKDQLFLLSFNFSASHLFLYLLLRRCFVVIQHLGKLLDPCQGLVDSPHFLTLSCYVMLHQAIGAIITLANAAHCFSISWAWLKFCGFCSESDVDFSAVLSQGISWWLRPQGWNSIWIETSNNHNFRHKLIIVIHHLL